MFIVYRLVLAGVLLGLLTTGRLAAEDGAVVAGSSRRAEVDSWGLAVARPPATRVSAGSREPACYFAFAVNLAEQVAADFAVLPVAGVVVVEEQDAGREGAEAGQADVVDDDDGRVAGPFDRAA